MSKIKGLTSLDDMKERKRPAYYTPEKDKNGSLVLVAWVRGAEADRGHAEAMAYIGSHIQHAFDVDQGAIEQVWAEGFDIDQNPDGLYVLRVRWRGYGEDVELYTEEARPLNDEERRTIYANGSLESVVHEWIAEWEGVPCLACKSPAEAHSGFAMACPVPELRK